MVVRYLLLIAFVLVLGGCSSRNEGSVASASVPAENVTLYTDKTMEPFLSIGDFIKYQDELGYIFLGRFGENWPATMMEEKTAMNEISFTLKSGTNHTYPGYSGYELKVVRLLGDNNEETMVVLRSKEKR